MAADTERPERVSVPLGSLASLSMVHPLMVALFLSPSNVWQMMHTKAKAMGITQLVMPFVVWVREATIESQQGINSLTSVDLADTTLEQRQGIRKSLPPP